jgi:hypothetical protein
MTLYRDFVLRFNALNETFITQTDSMNGLRMLLKAASPEFLEVMTR